MAPVPVHSLAVFVYLCKRSIVLHHAVIAKSFYRLQKVLSTKKVLERIRLAGISYFKDFSFLRVEKNSSVELFFWILMPYDCPTKALLLTLLWN